MANRKRKLEFSSREERDWVAPDCVPGDKCVYCGRHLDGSPAEHLYARATTRSFPVCDEACAAGVEAYVRADKRFKPFLYIALAACAVLVLFSALAGHEGFLLHIAIIVAGVAFALFPYPITSFETFQSCSIKTVTRAFRILGVVLVAAGALFLVTVGGL